MSALDPKRTLAPYENHDGLKAERPSVRGAAGVQVLATDVLSTEEDDGNCGE
jgi:hypothetical protein